ncbi:hypothetical protein GDO86_001431 [Hymenochirus boettgeri]|uniref:Uncharacterized protein n=1 Tax=Hymenochirus boettgeri TaxID=247094 RepID=A0A8T2KFU1_9PIPI|nr:hypothetical protein GDO86_001431 [Hymenochirus boettgeri]
MCRIDIPVHTIFFTFSESFLFTKNNIVTNTLLYFPSNLQYFLFDFLYRTIIQLHNLSHLLGMYTMCCCCSDFLVQEIKTIQNKAEIQNNRNRFNPLRDLKKTCINYCYKKNERIVSEEATKVMNIAYLEGDSCAYFVCFI